MAPPLILVAVTHVLMTTDIEGHTAARLAGLLILNTTVASVIGLTVAIPAIIFFGYLRNRATRLVLEVGIVTEEMMSRFSGVSGTGAAATKS